ncbi:transcriptional regulator [Undibacterium sp. SXout7W]|uniref:transcriptional regulator n=1 Tax=Undibacterium sp. SXout7W TaxID=3413049 RepID=UPI003BF27275
MPRLFDEKQAFALRLKQALKRSKKKVETPLELSIQFNLRHQTPVTPQAAQKWLTGLSQPTPDKIETLAQWLNVSAQWLRFGIAEKPPAQPAKVLSLKNATNRDAFSPEEIQLMLRIRTLSEHQRFLVTETIAQFALHQEMWQD